MSTFNFFYEEIDVCVKIRAALNRFEILMIMIIIKLN